MAQDLTPTEIEAITKALGSPSVSTLTPQKRATLSPHVSHAQFSPFLHEGGHPHQHPLNPEALNALQDVKIEIHAILGKTKLTLKQLMELKQGSLIQLDKLAGEPVELIDESGKVIARGEVVVVDDNYGIQIH